MVFGKKGAGKTTLLTKLSIKYNKLGYHVFSNVEIFGCYRLYIDDIGFRDFPPNSVILIDEVSLIWDNRNFKSFKPEVTKFFRLQRHNRIIVYLFSQNFDVDKKIRDLCDDMYLLTNIFGFMSIARKIRKTPTLHTPESDDTGKTNGEGFITEDFTFDFPSTWIWTYIPRYIKFFNSFEIEPMLPVYRDKFKFLNEPYLYRITHTRDYILDFLHDVYLKSRKEIHAYRFGISRSPEDVLKYIRTLRT